MWNYFTTRVEYAQRTSLKDKCSDIQFCKNELIMIVPIIGPNKNDFEQTPLRHIGYINIHSTENFLIIVYIKAR